MGEDRDGHPVWYDNFNYDFKGVRRCFRGALVQTLQLLCLSPVCVCVCVSSPVCVCVSSPVCVCVCARAALLGEAGGNPSLQLVPSRAGPQVEQRIHSQGLPLVISSHPQFMSPVSFSLLNVWCILLNIGRAGHICH